MSAMDFPATPAVGDTYTNGIGVTYQWNGVAWVTDFQVAGAFKTVSDLLYQIRVLLQDTDTASGGYRYTTDSLVANINMGLLEMFRLRPDIFLEVDFVPPEFTSLSLSAVWPLDRMFIPPIVYYAVGLAQARDDEGTQDARAGAFQQRFVAMLMTVGA